MLLFLLGLSVAFFTEPIIDQYPDDARVFPQLTSAAVFIGVTLLLVRSYLPSSLQAFVVEDVTITADTEELEESVDIDDDSRSYEKENIAQEYGYTLNDTWFMVWTAIAFFIAGWAAGFMFAAPVYVIGYTLFYKVHVAKGVFLAALAMAILWVFVEFLGMPFDQGALLDFSPLIPFSLTAGLTVLPGGG